MGTSHWRASDHETVRFGHPHKSRRFQRVWTPHTASRSSRGPALFPFHPTGTADHGPETAGGFGDLLLQLLTEHASGKGRGHFAQPRGHWASQAWRGRPAAARRAWREVLHLSRSPQDIYRQDGVIVEFSRKSTISRKRRDIRMLRKRPFGQRFGLRLKKSRDFCCPTRLSNALGWQQDQATALSVLFREDSTMTPR